MKNHYFYENYKQPIALALGFFDCVHIGHKSLIVEMKKLAKKFQAESAVMTFANDPNLLLNKENQIYSITERSIAISNFGVDNLLYAYFNDEFLSLDWQCFLDTLTENFDIKAIVIGKDYTFGKCAAGNAEMLKKHMAAKNIYVKIMRFQRIFDKKVSTSTLKICLKEGKINRLNECLSQPYFIIGSIIHGNARGTVIGYPTANVSVHNDCLHLADGIYATRLYVDSLTLNGMTNVGSKPTFDDLTFGIETHLFDFHQDIYGKEVRLEFLMKIRDVQKFTSLPAMIKQLGDDERAARDYFKSH